MPTLEELKQKKVDLIDKARAEFDRLQGDRKRPVEDWSATERQDYMVFVQAAEAADKEFNDLNTAVTASDRLNQMALDLDDREKKSRDRVIVPDSQNSLIRWGGGKQSGIRVPERAWERTGNIQAAPAYSKAWAQYLRGQNNLYSQEYMAASGLTSDNEERAGYFITPESFMSEIIKQVDDAVFVQKLSRVIMMPPAKSLGVRVRRSRASTFTWAGENTDISTTRDTSLSYGKRLLTPNYLQGSVVISRDLVRNVPSSEGMVIEEIGIDLNYKLEPAFLTGTGSMQPMGLLAANTDGISTGRDITAAATSFTFDDWVNMKYNLKNKYRSRATWMVHRFVLNQTALLKDGMGQYLWQPSRQVDAPDLILGTPVVETEWMPYAVTSGLYYALLGDFSYYWIVYEMGMEMQRLVETMARTNEYEYLFRCKLDAQPVLEEAFTRGKRG